MNVILHNARRLAPFEKTRPRRASIAAALSALRLTVAGRPATRAGRGLPLRGVPLWRRARLRRFGQTHQTVGLRAPAPPWRAILAAVSFGALLMYIFDPAQGRRRRALAGDQMRTQATLSLTSGAASRAAGASCVVWRRASATTPATSSGTMDTTPRR